MKNILHRFRDLKKWEKSWLKFDAESGLEFKVIKSFDRGGTTTNISNTLNIQTIGVNKLFVTKFTTSPSYFIYFTLIVWRIIVHFQPKIPSIMQSKSTNLSLNQSVIIPELVKLVILITFGVKFSPSPADFTKCSQ
jgi:hypothetical protein